LTDSRRADGKKDDTANNNRQLWLDLHHFLEIPTRRGSA